MNKTDRFTSDYYGGFQHRYFADEKLSEGFVRHHKRNFQKYFCLKESDFAGKKVLETGCGSGKHAVVLALMGADVVAVDLSLHNIKIAGRFKKMYGLKNLKYVQHDLMKPFKERGFDLISAHNWVHHAKNPSLVIRNLVSDNLRINGRIYLSLYHARTFRFFIAHIARKVLKKRHYKIMRDIVKFHFPNGFSEFHNPEDVFLENIFDDYFVPYMMPIDYDIIMKDLGILGCDPITPVPSVPAGPYGLDNIKLRMGFEKREDAAYRGRLFFTKAIDEFSGELPSDVSASVRLAKRAIRRVNSLDNPYLTCAFCLGLYKVRAFTSGDSMGTKHAALQRYLGMVLSDSLRPISYMYDVKKLYGQREDK
ncbi:MAG: methyltransferase domain-containing protein [Candidatus Omnitrophota bacterium]